MIKVKHHMDANLKYYIGTDFQPCLHEFHVRIQKYMIKCALV